MQKLKDDFRKNGGRFEKIKVGDIFDIRPTKHYGLTNNKLFRTKGSVPVVVNSSVQNGIGGYVNLKPTEKANTITFSDTTTADSIFLQDRDFIGYSHVQGLYPKQKFNNWNEKSLLYFVSAFKKSALQHNFDYSNKFNRKIASKLNVFLPVYADNQLAFSYMENYVRELEAERVRELEAYLWASGLNDYVLTDEEEQALRERERERERERRNYSEFAFSDIFHKAKTGDVDIQRRHVNGKGEMYINSGRENQGIVGRTDIKARIFPAHTITVDMFGYAWYRDFVYKMATHAHVFSLETKEKYSENALLYLAAAMFHLKNKYSYSNMCNWTKMCQEKLYLPVTSSGSPDHKFMEIKIRAVMKITVKHLVQWKDTELEALKQAVCE